MSDAFNAGSKTPGHGGGDAFNAGSKTPGYSGSGGGDSWGTKTPAYQPQPAQQAQQQDSWSNQAPQNGWGSNPYDAPTPGPYNAPTPGAAMNAPTPGAYSAPTPGP